jgi:flagellar protein FlgJ
VAAIETAGRRFLTSALSLEGIAGVGRAQGAAEILAADTRAERIAKAAAQASATRASAVALASRPGDARAVPETFRKFEGMVLQTFVQSMLPEESESVYGQGLAGDMWKSFLAKEIADQMARSGGIGIADRVLGDHYLSGEKKVPVSGLPGAGKKTGLATQELLSTALVQEMQRTMVKAMDEDLAAAGRSGAGGNK